MLSAFFQRSKPRAEGPHPEPSNKRSGELRNDGRCLYLNALADSLRKVRFFLNAFVSSLWRFAKQNNGLMKSLCVLFSLKM